MWTVDQLLDVIVKKIDNDDSHINSDLIVNFFNDCAARVATEVNIRQLATVADVTLTASQNLVALPDNYCKGLKKAYNKTLNFEIKVCPSRIIVDRIIGSRIGNGSVTHLAEDGSDIYYRETPAADQTATIYYHRYPDPITEGMNFPSWIPTNFIYELFYHHACYACYDIIEDGITGEKVNTLYHEDKFEKVVAKFVTHIGPYPDYPFSPDKMFDFEDHV